MVGAIDSYYGQVEVLSHLQDNQAAQIRTLSHVRMLRLVDGPPLSLVRWLRRSKQLCEIQVVHSLTGHFVRLVNNCSFSVPGFLSGADLAIHLASICVLCSWNISNYSRCLS